MRTGRPTVAIVLTDAERKHLESLARRSRTSPQVARRARVVLACAAGHNNQTVARRLRLSPATVGKWRVRFARDRADGLLDEPRPGAPRTVTDDQVEQVVITTLEATPPGATHWSTRSLARTTGLSRMTISRIWHAFGLRPHRSETFKLSPDPQLIDKVRDIVGLYINPPEHAVVLCVDEKSQIQALDRTAPLLPMQPGQAERRTHDSSAILPARSYQPTPSVARVEHQQLAARVAVAVRGDNIEDRRRDSGEHRSVSWTPILERNYGGWWWLRRSSVRLRRRGGAVAAGGAGWCGACRDRRGIGRRDRGSPSRCGA